MIYSDPRLQCPLPSPQSTLEHEEKQSSTNVAERPMVLKNCLESECLVAAVGKAFEREKRG